MAKNTPHPIALTAAMLMTRSPGVYTEPIDCYWDNGASIAWEPMAYASAASLASDLHRIAKATHRLAEAECNGEWRPGQREHWHRQMDATKGLRHLAASRALQGLDASIAKYAQRLDRRLAKINASLAPFALSAERRGDPRGFTLVLVSTDPARPVPSNGMESGAWGVA